MAEYLVRDSRGNTGSSMVFWALTGGYTSNISLAERFTQEKAESLYRNRDTDEPILLSIIEQHSYFAVDCQTLAPFFDGKVNLDQAENFYLIRNNSFDGNNVAFLSHQNKFTFNLSDALIVPHLPSLPEYRAVPATYIQNLARPVVRHDAFDVRRAIRKGCIKTHPLKRKSVSKGMVRNNCSTCGRLFWSHYYDVHDCTRCSAG